MGSKHRQASRMQQGKAASAGISGAVAGAVAGAFGAVAGVLLKRQKLAIPTLLVVFVVLACAFLYPPAQRYYQTLRTNDQLNAEYAALVERNEALQSDVEALQTEAGIEARAHEQLGWVKAGEETANVRGLDIPYDHSESIRANIPAGNVEAPNVGWYTPLLDAIFQVDV